MLTSCVSRPAEAAKAPGDARLNGHMTGVVAVFTDSDSNIFFHEIDGKPVTIYPIYLKPGRHEVSFYAHSKYHRSAIVRFDFEAKEDALYEILPRSGGELIKVSFVRRLADGKEEEIKSWDLPTTYSRGRGATLPIFLP
jgi:hypothetical protein